MMIKGDVFCLHSRYETAFLLFVGVAEMVPPGLLNSALIEYCQDRGWLEVTYGGSYQITEEGMSQLSESLEVPVLKLEEFGLFRGSDPDRDQKLQAFDQELSERAPLKPQEDKEQRKKELRCLISERKRWLADWKEELNEAREIQLSAEPFQADLEVDHTIRMLHLKIQEGREAIQRYRNELYTLEGLDPKQSLRPMNVFEAGEALSAAARDLSKELKEVGTGSLPDPKTDQPSESSDK